MIDEFELHVYDVDVVLVNLFFMLQNLVACTKLSEF